VCWSGSRDGNDSFELPVIGKQCRPRPMSPMTMRRQVFAIVAVFAIAAAGVVWRATAPSGRSIYLVPAGQPGHEESERHACAEWRPNGRGLSRFRDWWLVVPKGGSLHSEIRAAKRMEFEVDPGSGLADMCLGDEVDFQSGPGIVKEVLEACHRRDGFLARRARPEEQVALQMDGCL
jgi:hypothetical protein